MRGGKARSRLHFKEKSWLEFLFYASLSSDWTNCVAPVGFLVLLIPVFTCVGSQGAGCQQNVGSERVCACVRVRVPVCQQPFVFLSQFSIPALRGECFLSPPPLFEHIPHLLP